jgi:hypothetical protein
MDSWAIEFYETPTLKSIGKYPIYEHGSFIVETPLVPYSQDITSEPPLLCAPFLLVGSQLPLDALLKNV